MHFGRMCYMCRERGRGHHAACYEPFPQYFSGNRELNNIGIPGYLGSKYQFDLLSLFSSSWDSDIIQLFYSLWGIFPEV